MVNGHVMFCLIIKICKETIFYRDSIIQKLINLHVDIETDYILEMLIVAGRLVSSAENPHGSEPQPPRISQVRTASSSAKSRFNCGEVGGSWIGWFSW